MRLVLASQSPRRAALVRLLGVPEIEIISSNVDEVEDTTLSPAELVRNLASQKAEAVAARLTDPTDTIVLGADTLVALNGEILSKPLDAADAKRMLRLLSDRTHTVYTGVALVMPGSMKQDSFVEQTDVTFRALADDEIDAYVASGSPMDKAGAYGIQEDFGAVFVSRIDGDYYNVVGLPLCSVYQRLYALLAQK